MLARDERIGLLIAAVVGAAAISTYFYRASKLSRPQSAAGQPVHEISDDQNARDGYAQVLEQAFGIEHNAATVTADGTTLRVRWEMCSKQMLQRLLRDDQNLQVKTIREVSGLSVKRLKSHGFKKIVCDDGRKGLEPSAQSL